MIKRILFLIAWPWAVLISFLVTLFWWIPDGIMWIITGKKFTAEKFEWTIDHILGPVARLVDNE